MRLLFSLFLSLIFSAAFSQTTFEGVIKWSMTIGTGTGTTAATPQLSAKEQAELKEGIAEMEKQMNDPQMQEAFKANPSMKASLEQRLQMMKAMQSMDGTSGIVPKGFTMKMKDGNSLTKLEGGMAAAMGDILHLKATDKTYYIKTASKTYSVQPPAKTTTPQQEATTKVVATTETKKIISYTCTKYIVTTTKGTSVQTAYIWATKEIKDLDSKSFHGIGANSHSTSDAVKSIDGVPLRIEATEQGQTVVLEVTSITKQSLPASDFAIPAGYKEVPFGQ